MTTPQRARSTTETSWTLIHDFGGDPVRGVGVEVTSTSARATEVFIVGLHGDVAPTTEEGHAVQPGTSQTFRSVSRNGDPRIRAIYFRVASSSSVATHSVTER